jgi:hypothetical protein
LPQIIGFLEDRYQGLMVINTAPLCIALASPAPQSYMTIKYEMAKRNYLGLLSSSGSGRSTIKSPQPVYTVCVDGDSTDLTSDDNNELTKRLNAVFLKRLKQSESGGDHIAAQKKHPAMESELCIDSPLLTCLSPAEQDLLGKIQCFFGEIV